MDGNKPARHDIPKWSETLWGGMYDPIRGVAMYLHAGRLRGNVEWWWLQTAVYLPGGRVAVERSWVKNESMAGVVSASLDFRMEHEGWSARYDGIPELTTTEALARTARGCSAPSPHMQFEVIADASRPLWDMHEWIAGKNNFPSADMHYEQMGRCKGELRIGDELYILDGISYYDHSSGVRDWRHFHSHHFACIAMPNATIHQIGVYESPTEERPPLGVYFTKDGQALKLVYSTMPRMTNTLGAPLQYNWILQTESGEKQTYRVEVLHNFPMTITEENDNINGIDWDLPGDPLYLTECQVRVTAPAGSIGYGHVERSNRRSCIFDCKPQ